MAETFCDSDSVKLKAGADAATLTAGEYTELINQAECYINTVVAIPGVNLVDDYANMDADVKKILEDAASSHAAMAVINYDMTVFGRLAYAQTMLNFNYTRLTDCINLLKDKSEKIAFIRSFNT